MALALSYAGTSDVSAPFGGLTATGTLTNVGDLITFLIFCGGTGTPTCTGIAVTGTGAVVGTALTKNYQAAPETNVDYEIWSGVVSTTGSVTFTTSWSTSISSANMIYSAREFTVSGVSNPIWSVTAATTILQAGGGGGTTVKGPSITPSTTNYAYMGHCFPNSTGTAGSTTGFEYDPDGLNGFVMYNPSVAASAIQPTFTQATTNDGFVGVGALVSAAAPGGGLLGFF
jgi:hypothetical protein